MKKLFVTLLLLCCLVILSAALLLNNPHWASSLIEKRLRQQGITATIEQVTANWSGTEYHLNASFSGSSKDYGLDIRRANLSARLDWKKLWQKQPFIQYVGLSHGELQFDKSRLPRWKADFEALKKQPTTGDSSRDYSRYLPQNWSITEWKIGMDNQRLTLSANGLQDQQVQATLTDSHSGSLAMEYSQEKQRMQLSSTQLDLAALTGYPAVLQNVDAVINTENWAGSRLESRLIYQGISSDIRVQGSDNTLELTAQVDGEPLKAVVRYDDYGAQLRFSEVNIATLMVLKPLLPETMQRLHLGGVGSGVVEYDYQRGIRLATLNLSAATISHPELLASRLSARVWFQNQQLKYRLSIDNGTLLFPTIFEQKSHRVDAEIAGLYDVAKQQVLIDALGIKSPDFQRLTASGSVQLAADPILDIQAELVNMQLAKVSRYLPTEMSSKARQWLSQALVSGQENQTKVTLKGAASQLMSAEDSVLLINSQLRNSVLHYLDNNPRIHLKQAQLVIDKSALSVISQEASIEGLPLTATVDIEDLLNTRVAISARMQKQQLSRMQAVAVKSLAKTAIQRVQKTVKADGLFDLDLTAVLNVSEADEPDTFHIRLHTDSAAVTLKQYPDLAIKKTAATVFINENGLKQIAAKGQLNNQPIQLDLAGSDKGYHINALLTAEAVKILPQLKLITAAEASVLKQFKVLSGKSRYRLSMDLAANGSLRHIDVTSLLLGTQINLFDTVKKTAKQKNTMILTYVSDKQYLKFHIDKLLMVKVGWDDKGQLVGVVVDNRSKNQSYQSGKAKFHLASQRLNGSALNAFINAYNQQSKKPTSRRKLNYDLLIDVKQLAFKKGKTYPLSIKGDSSNIVLNSPIINGNIQYQANQLNAQLTRAEIDKLFDLVKQTTVNQRGKKVETISLANALPQLDINIKEVVLKGKSVGNFHLETSIREGLYSIDQGLLAGDNYFLELAGHEAKEPQGITTYIQADFKGERIADVIRQFSLNEMINAKNLDISANLAWPGRAHTLNLQQSYGKAKMQALNVKLLKMSSGVGSVVGLMDVTGILKRISLDFQNLNSSKISFDTVQGNWNIGGGRAVTRDYYADGSVIALKINGAIDLHRRTFDDVKVSVIPRASNILPIVGAVAGGVVGVAAGFFIQQVIGDNLDEVVGIPYEIAGSWDDPQVNYIGDKKLSQ